jgi:2',3'-cyclic-nucleotide 2'-phosphodiesterase (5'-nucleotidase family)
MLTAPSAVKTVTVRIRRVAGVIDDTVLRSRTVSSPVRLLHYSDIENAHDDPELVAGLAGTIGALRDDRTLVCGTGDNVAPGVLPLVSEGEVALDFFEAVSPTVETFGNHDFDFGPDRTAEIVRRSPQRWLSANVRLNGSPFAGVDPWHVERVGDERVGFFGLTDPTTPSIGDSDNRLEFTDPIAAAGDAIDALRAHDVDHVVALSHLGRRDDELAATFDIDVVLGGHVHSERVERIAGTVLTRPGSGGHTLFEIDLPTGDVTRHAVADGSVDSALAATYRARIANAGLDTVVARVDDPISRTDADAFRGESRVGNFVADAYRWAAERALGADLPVVGLQNSGGIRTGPPLAGDVTAADLISLVPFDEPLVVAELSGDTLRSVFAEAADTPGFGESDWWHAHVSGARLTYDHDDGRLRAASVGGEPVVDSARYTLAFPEFLLYTTVEFPTLTADLPIERLDTQYELLIEYAEAVGIDPSIEGRIVRNGV